VLQEPAAVPPKVTLAAVVETVAFSSKLTVQTKLVAEVPLAIAGPVIELIPGAWLSTVAALDPATQRTAEFPTASAPTPEAIEAIFTVPLPVQLETVTVAVFAKPCATVVDPQRAVLV
jgi:hypothetical protein